MKTLKQYRGSVLATAILAIVMVYFNNCGQVEFGTTNQKPTDTLVVDNSVPPGDGENPDDPQTPPGGDPELPDEPPVNPPDGHPWDGHKNCKAACGNNGIKDIIVNIDHIEVRGTHGEILTITGDLGETSIIGGSLPIALSDDIEIVSIRLVLASSGNYLIDNDDKQINLKTPSGQQSGLKIPFQGALNSSAGAYEVNFKIDPATQIVKAGKKCLLKPVLHFESFDSI
jgi:hypothetical protein